MRVRHGVYALPDAHPDVIRAAAIGGRVTGVAALPHLGLWTPPPHEAREFTVEVRVSTTVRAEVSGHEAPARSGVPRIHWTRERTNPQFGLAPLESVLARAAEALPLPHAVAVLDSALRHTPLTRRELALAAARWRPPARAAAAMVDERSDSGTESVLRVLLHEAGIPTTPQPPVPIGDRARADLLVGDRLVIECDSEAYHAETSHRRADLRRDEVLMALGYRVLRLDYSQVLGDPAGVVATVAALVSRGDHLSVKPTRGR